MATPKNNTTGSLTDRNSQRLYVIYILSVLKRHSDKEHPLSLKQIQEYICKDFPGEIATPPNITTLRKQMEVLLSVLDRAHVIDDDTGHELRIKNTLQLGFSIGQCLQNDEGNFEDYDPDAAVSADRHISPKETKYYYLNSLFDKSEISMLIDSLEAHNYLSAQDISDLILKIVGLSPLGMESYQKKNYNRETDDPRLEKYQAYLLDNLRELRKIIKNGQFANIQNCYYDREHHLQPVYSNYALVRPLRLMFNNGYYYLIAVQYSKNNDCFYTVHYRVDRLSYIEAHDPDESERLTYPAEDPGDAAAYRLHHPVMYGDDIEDILMHVTNRPRMLNVIHDIFGTHAKIREIDDKTLEVRVQAAIGGMRLLATEYCADLKILSPEKLRNSVIEDLKKALTAYSE